jgi:hypothetical protein
LYKGILFFQHAHIIFCKYKSTSLKLTACDEIIGAKSFSSHLQDATFDNGHENDAPLSQSFSQCIIFENCNKAHMQICLIL